MRPYIVALLAALSLSPATITVSPNGNDSADGVHAPVATIQRAIDRAATFRSVGERVAIVLDGGTYFLSGTLVFRPITGNAPLVFTAKRGTMPVISGGTVIRGTRRTENGRMIIACDRSASINQLFVNGRRYVRARSPNADDIMFWHLSASGARTSGGAGSFEYAADTVPVQGAEGAEIVFIRLWDISRFSVTGIDTAKRILQFRVPPALKEVSHWGAHKPYYMENAASFLDAPGEWYYDPAAGEITVIPFPGDDLAAAEVIAPRLAHLIKFQGDPSQPVANISFEGISFMHTTWSFPAEGYDGHQADLVIGAGIEGTYAESISFSRCSFTAQGRYALGFQTACRGITINACTFTDIGAGAVLFGEAGNPQRGSETMSNTFINCHVHHIGVIYPSAVGVWVGYAAYNRIASNHIHNTPYSGISVGWGWDRNPGGAHHNIIERNYLHDIQEQMGDGGAIYTQSHQPGTVIRNNMIHDVFGQKTYGTGIYLDNYSSHITVSNNIVARTAGASHPQNDPRSNRICNNVFVLPPTGVFHINKGVGGMFERNIIYIS
ncbi:MAG: right-handed parallel beta-helix repeat-containing protein, partial [Spirochaetota bacterium]